MKIYPSILSADFSCLKDEIIALQDVDGIHFDVMDGHFVPNLTFGPDFINSCREINKKLFFDLHLIIERPAMTFKLFENTDLITFHFEKAKHPDLLIKEIKKIGKKVGIALLPSTSHHVLEYILDQIDLVLVMSVNPGFAGQDFLPYNLRKVEKIRQMIDSQNLKTEIQIDGGIKLENIKDVAYSGVDIAVVGSGFFGIKKNFENYTEIMHEFKKRALLI